MEWQPIETAPKDGTKILVWVFEEILQNIHYDMVHWETRTELTEYGYEGFVSGQISPDSKQVNKYMIISQDFYTHWMPLPKTPTK